MKTVVGRCSDTGKKNLSFYLQWSIFTRSFRLLHLSRGPEDIFHQCPRGHSAEQKSGSRRISVTLKTSEGGEDWCFIASVVYDLVAVSHIRSSYQTSYFMSVVKSWGRLYLHCVGGPSPASPIWKTRPNRESFDCMVLGRKQMKGWTDERCDVSDRRGRHRTSGLYWNVLNVHVDMWEDLWAGCHQRSFLERPQTQLCPEEKVDWGGVIPKSTGIVQNNKNTPRIIAVPLHPVHIIVSKHWTSSFPGSSDGWMM